jgi:hypothetical protein
VDFLSHTVPWTIDLVAQSLSVYILVVFYSSLQLDSRGLIVYATDDIGEIADYGVVVHCLSAPSTHKDLSGLDRTHTEQVRVRRCFCVRVRQSERQL